jgi:hypothetical protein
MKNILLPAAICFCTLTLHAQEVKTVKDTTAKGIQYGECLPVLLPYIDTNQLSTRSVLFVFNESLHPLGRHEFYDAGAPVKYLHIPMRMNRCTLLYIDTGLHHFHTMYQQLKVPVHFEQGKIYMARLFTRTIWPVGGISVIKKNEQGDPVEYAAVLFEFINSNAATELMNKMKKKEVIVNE